MIPETDTSTTFNVNGIFFKKEVVTSDAALIDLMKAYGLNPDTLISVSLKKPATSQVSTQPPKDLPK